VTSAFFASIVVLNTSIRSVAIERSIAHGNASATESITACVGSQIVPQFLVETRKFCLIYLFFPICGLPIERATSPAASNAFHMCAGALLSARSALLANTAQE